MFPSVQSRARRRVETGPSKSCSCIDPIHLLFKRSKLSSARIDLCLLTAPHSLPTNMQAFPSLQTQRYPQSPPSSLEPARKTETPSDDETRAGRTRKVRQQVCQHMHRLSEGGTTGGDIVNEHLTHLSAYRSAGVGVSPLGTGGRKPAIRRPRWRVSMVS